MKAIKLNGNFAGYPRWRYALQFGKPHKEKAAERRERMKYAALFQKLYGPSVSQKPDLTSFLGYSIVANENWFNDAKRSRIYYSNESDLTAILLLQ